MKTALLLTATITPQYSSNHLTRMSPELRFNDYLNSLKLWLNQNAFDYIVFCENSNYDLNKLKKQIEIPPDVDIEFLSYMDTPNEKLGYGFSELGLIDFAFDNSKLLKQSTFFIKATGRLFFPKLKHLLPRITLEDLFYIDARDNFLFWQNRYIPMQLMVFSKKFYKENFYKQRESICTSVCLEAILFDVFMKYKNVKGANFRFPFNINPVGIAAHSNISYATPKWFCINIARAISRKFFPNLWI